MEMRWHSAVGVVVVVCGAFAVAGGARIAAQGEPTATVTSPDGAIVMTVSRVASGGAGATRLAYQVTFNGEPVIAASALGIELDGQPPMGPAMSVVSVTPSDVDETYTLPVGKTREVRNHYRAMTVELREPEAPGRRMALDVRATDDGVAFRYRVPEQDHVGDVRITNEATEFQLAGDATTYPLFLRGYRTSWEDDYQTLPLSGINPANLIALPFLTWLPGHAYIAIAEADLHQYAGLYLRHSARSARSLVAQLSPQVDDATVAVTGRAPIETPWRVIMIGRDPGTLIESNLIVNLNAPSAIADTSWIEAGKSAWDWWSGEQADGVSFTPGMNTATMAHYIDFASASGLEYMLVDAGWAARLGRGANDSNDDITKPQPDIDMPALLAHAKAKHVRLWLWAHWSDVERQMDEAFPLYERWGIAGVKIDFMDRNDQSMVDFYHRVAKTAADHHLMIDFHGAYAPDGLRRTYPNLMTREGVLGAEYNKWSARDTVDHRVMLAFTRMLAGPMDYTPGGFRNVTADHFVPRNVKPMVMGTRAHQLALYVVFESPLEMVADYPEAYAEAPEMPFLREVPATWDETRVVAARVGDYVAIARRHGDDWYIGAIAGSHGAAIQVPLGFLRAGTTFQADVYADAPDAATRPTATAIEHRTMTRETVVRMTLVPGGGQAIRLHAAE
jgi:alpha-glucosidase